MNEVVVVPTLDGDPRPARAVVVGDVDRQQVTRALAPSPHDVVTVDSAGDAVRHTARDSARTARRTTSGLAHTTSDRIGPVADEARRRAVRAYDALAGHRPGLPWGWLVGAGLIGVAVGWAAGSAVRAAAERAEEELRAAERVEFVDMDRSATTPAVG